MKAVIINKYGGPEVLEYVDVVTPEPGPDEILIKTKAISVNPVDWKVRQGKLKIITGKKFPIYLGVEASGIVEKTGEAVKGFEIGKKVFAGKNHTGGAYAEYFCVKQENAVILPDEMSFEDGCTLAVTGVTSLQSLRDHGKLEEGMEVLINGASGGIGTYAVQIARILGAKVTGVCSTRNIKLVRSLGADKVIDYTQQNWSRMNEKYDIILDAVGNKTFTQVRNNLKKKGILIKLNITPKNWLEQNFLSLFSTKKAKMVLLKSRKDDVKWVRDQIAIGNIRVIHDKSFKLENTRKAHEYSETERARGKIILKP
ncbi:MAG: NAD(P)-dependent alcohol dehydrogenase [Bacteroidales bacterium]